MVRFISQKTNMEKFTHHDIHEIYSQITQSLNCVDCKAGILPHNISIKSMEGSECLFDVNCHRCDAEMSLSAQVEKAPNKKAATYNKSSQMLHDSWVDESVNELDILAIQNEMKHFGGSFIQRFAQV